MSDDQRTRLGAILADFDDDTQPIVSRARTRESIRAPITAEATGTGSDVGTTSGPGPAREHREPAAACDADDLVAAVTEVIDRGDLQAPPAGAPALLDQLDAMWGSHGEPSELAGPSPAETPATRVTARTPRDRRDAVANRRSWRNWTRRAGALALARFVTPAGALQPRRPAASWLSTVALLVLDSLLVVLLAVALTGNGMPSSAQPTDTVAEPRSAASHHTSQQP